MTIRWGILYFWQFTDIELVTPRRVYPVHFDNWQSLFNESTEALGNDLLNDEQVLKPSLHLYNQFISIWSSGLCPSIWFELRAVLFLIAKPWYIGFRRCTPSIFGTFSQIATLHLSPWAMLWMLVLGPIVRKPSNWLKLRRELLSNPRGLQF